MKAIKKEILLLLFVGFVLTGGCNKNSYSDIGVCDKSLFETVDEKGIIRIIVDLKMENSTYENDLTEDELRQLILEIQDEFIESLEAEGLNVSNIKRGLGVINPWLAMNVDKDALMFICKDERVNSVSQDELEYMH